MLFQTFDEAFNLLFLTKSFAGDSKGGGFSKEPPLAAGGKKNSYESSGWAGLTFFELTDITDHPEYGLVDPHGGHRFFQSARAVGEIRCVTHFGQV
jgi:hypothetical protein